MDGTKGIKTAYYTACELARDADGMAVRARKVTTCAHKVYLK